MVASSQPPLAGSRQNFRSKPDSFPSLPLTAHGTQHAWAEAASHSCSQRSYIRLDQRVFRFDLLDVSIFNPRTPGVYIIPRKSTLRIRASFLFPTHRRLLLLLRSNARYTRSMEVRITSSRYSTLCLLRNIYNRKWTTSKFMRGNAICDGQFELVR